MPYRNDPQSRIVPDTNCWLDAAFWPDSIAGRAINALFTAGKPIVLEELTENEALRILARKRVELGLRFNPVEHFNSYVARFLRVPAAPPVAVKVNRADAHIAHAAIHYRATVLTADAPFVAECLADNILAQFPWTAILSLGREPPADEILRLVIPGRDKGMIFARVTPGGWLGMKNVGSFTVADIRNVGRLYFDSATEEWVFDAMKVVRLPFPPTAQVMTLVCASYELPSSRKGKVILRAADPKSKTKQTKSESTMKFLKMRPGEIRVGASIEGRDFWNGSIRHLVVSPEGMSAKKWGAIISVPDAAPNPLNQGVLDRALLHLDGR